MIQDYFLLLLLLLLYTHSDKVNEDVLSGFNFFLLAPRPCGTYNYTGNKLMYEKVV